MCLPLASCCRTIAAQRHSGAPRAVPSMDSNRRPARPVPSHSDATATLVGTSGPKFRPDGGEVEVTPKVHQSGAAPGSCRAEALRCRAARKRRKYSLGSRMQHRSGRGRKSAHRRRSWPQDRQVRSTLQRDARRPAAHRTPDRGQDRWLAKPRKATLPSGERRDPLTGCFCLAGARASWVQFSLTFVPTCVRSCTSSTSSSWRETCLPPSNVGRSNRFRGLLGHKQVKPLSHRHPDRISHVSLRCDCGKPWP